LGDLIYNSSSGTDIQYIACVWFHFALHYLVHQRISTGFNVSTGTDVLQVIC